MLIYSHLSTTMSISVDKYVDSVSMGVDFFIITS